jgi:hypothetical protein
MFSDTTQISSFKSFKTIETIEAKKRLIRERGKIPGNSLIRLKLF